MSRTTRKHLQRRTGHPFPLQELFELANSPEADAADPRRLAERVGMPVVMVRSLLSYYPDLHEDEATRVCRGTSCMLNGGRKLEQELGTYAPYQSLYCLGYCDRSPAVLAGDGRLAFGDSDASCIAGDGLNLQPPPPPIRVLSREPIVTRRIGRGDFSNLRTARSDGAYRALEKALALPPELLLAAVEASGERGRGGSGFPTGTKWRLCAEAEGEARYVVANGDEGDPGAFIDRVLMERDPHAILEGLILCGYAVGATQGIVFIRSEYVWAREVMARAIDEARETGVLGDSVLGTDFAFDVICLRGTGSYVGGEETALLNAIESLRSEARVRPPYPAAEGLFGQPTVVNNVETLVNVPFIVDRGPEAYAALGTAASSGTKAICLNRGFRNAGIVEIEFGLSLRKLVEEIGGGSSGDSELAAVLVGGPTGSVVFPQEWDVPICYDALRASGIELGHGGVIALHADADVRELLLSWLTFFHEESCGKCVPCGLGSKKALELVATAAETDDGERLTALLRLIETASLCGFGQRLPVPVLKLLERFGTDALRPGGTT